MCVSVLNGELFYRHHALKCLVNASMEFVNNKSDFFFFFSFILGHDTDSAHLDMTRVQISTLCSSNSQTKNGIKW